MKFRKIIFWGHLLAGVFCGAIIAIMSFTGVLIAFEHEIEDWANRKASHVTPPDGEPAPLSIKKIISTVEDSVPGFTATYVRIPRSTDQAYELRAGREQLLFSDPWSGEVRQSHSGRIHEFMHLMKTWHRTLGMSGEYQEIGKLINGVCNFMFLLLCISGLYLWIPYKWAWRNFKSVLFFQKDCRGKVRDLNWHNVIGFWNAAILVILAGTAVIFSFEWGHKLVFAVFGEEAPAHRDFRMMIVPQAPLPDYPDEATPLSMDDLLRSVQSAYPEWEAIGIRNPSKLDQETGNPLTKPQSMEVYLPALFSTMGYTPVDVDPYSGEILKATHWKDRSPGMRARVWARFLHTGEAFGFTGKAIASLSTFASLLLVYTGFALTWRRFRRSSKRRLAGTNVIRDYLASLLEWLLRKKCR